MVLQGDLQLCRPTDEIAFIDLGSLCVVFLVKGLEDDGEVGQLLHLAQVAVVIVFHQHDGPVDGRVGRHNERQISLMNAEAAHAVVGDEVIEHLVGVGTFDFSGNDGQQAMINGQKRAQLQTDESSWNL